MRMEYTEIENKQEEKPVTSNLALWRINKINEPLDRETGREEDTNSQLKDITTDPTYMKMIWGTIRNNLMLMNPTVWMKWTNSLKVTNFQ